MSSESDLSPANPTRTDLVFQRDGFLYELETTIYSIHSVDSLPSGSENLFKSLGNSTHALITTATIFHPQGGGQPSDIGAMSAADGTSFTVLDVRLNPSTQQVLHLGAFSSSKIPVSFANGSTINQSIDKDKRLLYSRLHTAGHVLGAAVRHLLEKDIPGFDELKASHFPDSAACEFQGLIAGAHKEGIQSKVNAYTEKAMPVEIDWWSLDDFRANGLERLIPENLQDLGLKEGEKLRVVKIVGAEVYPCGGTHVPTTKDCGKTTVKGIKRSKGTSRVSYMVE
ncbi:alanyl-tRNA synthetase [Patellaria atrata CBS 101060]|uniref:Alanyl-tRNA synthetase n=1 Tax=Patellaria atrata CBS 101060 TaxID=1346257 RepID=A0A9P4VUI6_9PEZI|nr:alanyl-tRNA synthetase [Patellaria atrata CBS 101060]